MSIAQVLDIYLQHDAVSRVGMQNHQIDKTLTQSFILVDLFANTFNGDEIHPMLAFDLNAISLKALISKWIRMSNKYQYLQYYLANRKHYKPKLAKALLERASIRVWHNPQHMPSWWAVRKHDIVFFHNFTYPYLIDDSYARLMADEIMHMHAYNDLSLRWVLPSRFNLRSLRNYGVAVEDATILPLPHSYNLPYQLHEHSPLKLLAFSRYGRHKAHAELARVASEANLSLTIFGDSTSTQEYRDEFKEAQQYESGKILILPRQDDAMFGAHFEHSNIFVSNSYHEGFGIPLIEAEAHSLPVLARRGTAMDELVREGWNGYLFDDVGELPGLADRILKDYARFARNAWKHSQRYALDAYRASYLRLIGRERYKRLRPER